ncbi:stage II sporulation protein M [Haloarcula japonica]|uniref:stage II sporulation protein M n=1 Tax=Haloarcula japonica TaxID=29282 RepID=UPI0039F68EAF
MGWAVYSGGFMIGFILALETGFVDPSGIPGVSGQGSLQSNIELIGLVTNNMLSVLVIVLGLLTMGIFTILIGSYTGLIHGIIIGTAISESVSVYHVAILFIPHAIVELPALFTAIAAGLIIPLGLKDYLQEEKSEPLTHSSLADTVKLFLLAETLVITSSIIEYSVTHSIIRRMLL